MVRNQIGSFSVISFGTRYQLNGKQHFNKLIENNKLSFNKKVFKKNSKENPGNKIKDENEFFMAGHIYCNSQLHSRPHTPLELGTNDMKPLVNI